MAIRARPAAKTSAYAGFDADYAHGYAHGELSPGERVGPPPASSGGKATVVGGLLVLIALGGGWALLGDRVIWPWPPTEAAAVSSAFNPRAALELEPAAAALANTAPPANAALRTLPAALNPPPSSLPPPASAKAATTTRAVPEQTTAALPPAPTSPSETPALPLPPPSVDAADPYQMRAAAVGLHPGLSRVLLARLSPTDYRNAGIAIHTAVAETPDSAVFVWPRQRKPELALFQVRFVPGAAPDCRRYVVTIAKDGWLTTALPMEKCAPKLGRAERK